MKLEQSAVCWAWTEAENRVPVTARAQLSALQARLSKSPPRTSEAREMNRAKRFIVSSATVLLSSCLEL
jgi:hypothetical protein